MNASKPPRAEVSDLLVLLHEATRKAEKLMPDALEPKRAVPEPEISFRPGAEWSDSLALGEAADIIGIKPDALRKRFGRRWRDGVGVVRFDGVEARKCGKKWSIRLHRSWLSGSPLRR